MTLEMEDVVHGVVFTKPLVEVVRDSEYVLLECDSDPLNIPNENGETFTIRPLGAEYFCDIIIPNTSGMCYCSSLFPDDVIAHPKEYTIGGITDTDDDILIEIHIDVEEGV